MAASFELSDCKLSVKTKVGTLDSGRDKVATVTFTGANSNAEAQTLLDFSGAVAALMAPPVLENYRVDTRLIKAGD